MHVIWSQADKLASAFIALFSETNCFNIFSLRRGKYSTCSYLGMSLILWRYYKTIKSNFCIFSSFSVIVWTVIWTNDLFFLLETKTIVLCVSSKVLDNNCINFKKELIFYNKIWLCFHINCVAQYSCVYFKRKIWDTWHNKSMNR